jgi:hypothetical protein
MQSALDKRDGSEARRFWDSVPLWPFAYERTIARSWVLLLAVPYGLISVYAAAFLAVERRSPPALGVGYLLTLGFALFLSGCFFRSWERTFRAALGELYVRGCVEETPVARYLAFSRDMSAAFRSRWRVAPILLCIGFTFAVNWIVGIEVLKGQAFNVPRPLLVAFGATMTVTFCAWSYAVGAVAWCLGVAARILWRLPAAVSLRIQFGHPDHCGGLRPLGSCALELTYPLLVGCALLTLWGSSRAIPLIYWTTHPFGNRYVDLLVPAARGAAVVCFALVTTLFVASMWTVHRRMAELRDAYELEYGQLRDTIVRSSIQAAISPPDHAKPAADQLSLMEKLSPEVLDVTAWPLDRRMVAKYAATPVVALISSFGKDLAAMLRATLGI